MDDETTARALGHKAGRNPGTFAGECPYPHSRGAQRAAWMDGLGEGRDTIQRRDGEEDVAEQASAEPDAPA